MTSKFTFYIIVILLLYVDKSGVANLLALAGKYANMCSKSNVLILSVGAILNAFLGANIAQRSFCPACFGSLESASHLKYR